MKTENFSSLAEKMAANLTGSYEFTPDNVFQEGCPENKRIIGDLVSQFMLPGSRIENAETFAELRRRSVEGQSCLMLAEHYSNFDFPVLYKLIEEDSRLGPETAASLLPIRGMKLSETTPYTAAFSRSYDTIIIYPSRSLDGIPDPNELAEVRKISVPINHSAMREMIDRKHHGRIITVFPAGTRYRPWVPSSRKGVREIHSYVKSFDNIMFVAINGNILPPHESDDMTKDKAVKDLMVITCSEIVSGRKFRREVESSAPEGCDPRQHVVDAVMDKLFSMHDAVEPGRIRQMGNA